MTSSPSSSTFCGHHDPPGLRPSHCLSPSHYCCPSSGLSLDHCNSPLTGGLAFRTSPFRSCTARPLVRTPVSSKAESKFLNVVLYHLVLIHFPASLPAMRHPHLLLNHTQLFLISKALFLLSPHLGCTSPTIHDGSPLRRHLCNLTLPASCGEDESPPHSVPKSSRHRHPREDDHLVLWPQQTRCYLRI